MCLFLAQQGNAHMIDTLRTRRLRTPDTKVMFSVFYTDGRTAYMRVDREAATHGNLFVMSLGREEQQRGTIPAGAIARVKRVH
jgi:hypothetical protein